MLSADYPDVLFIQQRFTVTCNLNLAQELVQRILKNIFPNTHVHHSQMSTGCPYSWKISQIFANVIILVPIFDNVWYLTCKNEFTSAESCF